MTLEIQTTPFGDDLFVALADAVARLKGDDPLAPVIILVPSNTTGLSVRRRLARGVGGRPGVAAIEVTTIERIAEDIAGRSVASRLPATTTVRSAAWRAALDESPGMFAEVAEHSATVRALVRAETALRDLDEVDVDRVAAASPLAGETVAIMRAAIAKRAGWYDVPELLSLASASVQAGTPVILFAPVPLRNREATLLRAIVALRDVVALVAVTGSSRADRTLRTSLATAGIEVPNTEVSAATPGSVIHASDSDDEVRAVVREVLVRLRTVPASRIAVLVASWSPYGRLLHEHLTAAGIVTNGPGVLSVADRSISRGFLALLRLAREGLGREALFDALGQLRVGGALPLGRWEAIARESGVVAGGDWSVRLDAQLDILQRRSDALAGDDDDVAQSRREGIERSRERTQALREFVVDLERDFATATAMSSWAELAVWAETLLRQFLPPSDETSTLPPGEQYALVALESAIAEAATLDAITPRANLSTLVDTLDAALDSARPRAGRFGEGVYVAPLSAAGVLDVDAVFVVGLAEDAYPGRAALDPLLPDEVRAVVSPRLPDSRDAIAEKERVLLAAFASAGDVVASFPRGDLRRNTARLPSRWLVPTLAALGGVPDLTATTWEKATGESIRSVHSHWGETRTTSTPATEREWRLRSLASGQTLDDAAVAAGVELIEARTTDAFTRFDGDLRHVRDGLPDYAGTGALVAPTTLERYAKCPHAYLMQDVLRVRPLEEPEESVAITPMDVGNLMHEAFDVFFRSLGDSAPGFGEPWTPDHHAGLREVAIAIAEQFEARGLTGHQRMWARERDSILRDLDRMLTDDSERRATADSKVLVTELGFGDDGPAAEIAVNGGVVRMKGKIDKVDEHRDGTLEVTDFKTGSSRDFVKIATDAVVGGTKLQLPAYARAASAAFEAEVRRTEYRFIRARPSVEDVSIVVDDLITETYAHTLGVLTESIAGGLFPAKAPDQPDYRFVSCHYCNPDGVGHADARGRYERKRHVPALATLVGLIDPQGQPEDES